SPSPGSPPSSTHHSTLSLVSAALEARPHPRLPRPHYLLPFLTSLPQAFRAPRSPPSSTHPPT
ncbi:MAG: hypothetical protein Q9188_007073, partial [Gyalolechia gomerana]